MGVCRNEKGSWHRRRCVLRDARRPVRKLVIPTKLVQGIKRDCKALPLTVRQMIVQQVQLQAIKRREEASTLQIMLPCPCGSCPADPACCILGSCNSSCSCAIGQSIWMQLRLHGLTL